MKTVAERAREALLRCVGMPLWLESYQPEIERAIREAMEDCAKIAEFEHAHGTNGEGIAIAIRKQIGGRL